MINNNLSFHRLCPVALSAMALFSLFIAALSGLQPESLPFLLIRICNPNVTGRGISNPPAQKPPDYKSGGVSLAKGAS